MIRFNLAAASVAACVTSALTLMAPAPAAAGNTVRVNLDASCTPPINVTLPVPSGASASAVESALIERYNTLLTANMPLNRFIMPEDIVVFAPSGVSGPHVIYVLGRRLLTVDAGTASDAGARSPRELAIRWARQLQQHLPRVCFRPPSLSEPRIPKTPPLRIATKVSEVSNLQGRVELWDRPLLALKGVQPDGQTAADRAEQLSRRVAQSVGRRGTHSAREVNVREGQVLLGRKVLLTLNSADAAANGVPSAEKLAGRVAARLRDLLD